MSMQVAGHQTEGYRISTSVYEGPLDLLLELIERAELDITRLALAQVTDQYLAHMQALQERDPAEVSAFLVIAARLVLIKSAALLPRPTLDHHDEEEDPAEALARQLILYKRFKEIAAWLEHRESAGLRSYLRVSGSARIEPRVDLTGITLNDLARYAYDILMGGPVLPALSEVVAAPRVTIREKIRSILDRLRAGDAASFRSMLDGARTRLEVVVTFLAMLELVKRHIVSASQDGLFSDIELSPLDNIDSAADMDLEFE